MEKQLLKYSLGIDVGKDQLDCCLSVIDTTQQVTIKGKRKFTNTLSGHKELHQWTQKQYKQSGIPLHVCMEATGVYHERCALFLESQGMRISVVLPNRARSYLKSLGLKSKNDKIDAIGLSQMGAEQQLDPWSALAKEFYQLRCLTRQHEDIQESITAHKNQLHAASYGMFKMPEIEKQYRKIIKELTAVLEKIREAILSLISNNDTLKQKVDLLTSIKGVGTLTAATVIGETGGFETFENIRQLVSYAGYDVVENQSGNRQGKTKISKKGNAHIRRILYLPALSAVTCQIKPFYDLHQRVFERSRITMKGYVAVQRKLLCMMYTLYKKHQYFDAEYQPCLLVDCQQTSHSTVA